MYLCSLAKEWLTLCFLPGLGCVLANKIVQHAGSPENVLQAGRELLGIPGVGPATVALLRDSKLLGVARNKAEQEIMRLEKNTISLVSLHCESYPSFLRNIPDPPIVLFYKGDIACLNAPVVAIVGSRAATEYGKRMSHMLAEGLAQNEITVISGGAHGIDAAAHRGAMRQGRTAAVFGCGLDVVYPKNHDRLFSRITEKGVLLSEYPLGTPPDKFRFPARNRIISGIASGVVVVEATEKSGSLITARLSLDQGRDIFAVPGRIDSMKSSGCHRLIQQGAHLVHTVHDILDELNIGSVLPAGALNLEQEKKGEAQGEKEKKLLSCLDVYPVDIDTLLRVTGFSTNEVYTLLLELELKGLVRQLPGQLYELN